AITPDPVRTDIAIANRRIDEMNAVADDPLRTAEAWRGYQEVRTRLQAELDPETLKQILPVIEIEPQPTESSEPPSPTPLLNATVTPQPESPVAPLPTLPNIPATSIPRIIP